MCTIAFYTLNGIFYFCSNVKLNKRYLTKLNKIEKQLYKFI